MYFSLFTALLEDLKAFAPINVLQRFVFPTAEIPNGMIVYGLEYSIVDVNDNDKLNMKDLTLKLKHMVKYPDVNYSLLFYAAETFGSLE